eukprot:TRINITY_DN23356_c0_g1_i1.p1 TRINITY_DN23356_c0_g1~~TRINITY_DN23356_c0_g1_i1.p1  ORF type:complete len:409 (-),score=29.86 TRINITY_DN23356_c0_g1_i1:60-1286(-)
MIGRGDVTNSFTFADMERAVTGGPGRLLDLDFDGAMLMIKSDICAGVRRALGYRMHEACEPCEKMIADCRTVLTSQPSKDWRWVMNRRIGRSWKARNPALVWLDDKVAQLERTAEHCGRELHLPIYAHATAGDMVAEAELRAAVRERCLQGESIVVKPRHGSNSEHVYLWPDPQAAGESTVVASVDAALTAWHESWKRESWNQNAVTKGAILQPLYSPMVAEAADLPAGMAEEANIDASLGRRSSACKCRPLELKVMVLFGEVVGGTLNTHSQTLWVARDGGVQLWDITAMRVWMKQRHLDRASRSLNLPGIVLETLRKALSDHWHFIRAHSERLGRSVGLDEIRVDWLLGDRHWGPRIGELTYMGTFALAVGPISICMARAFAGAHLHRLGLLSDMNQVARQHDGFK